MRWELVRATATEAGRDPDALDYIRWGSPDLSVERVEALAAAGVTRVVVPATDLDSLSDFAARHITSRSRSRSR